MGWDVMGRDGMGPAMGMKPLPLPHSPTLQRCIPVMCFMSLPEIREIPFLLSFSFFPCLSQSFSPFAGPDSVHEQQHSSGEWSQPWRSRVIFECRGSFFWGCPEILICSGMDG